MAGIIIHGRSDATLNPGGVRIGTAEIYAQVEQVPEVIEALAIGQNFDNDVRIVLFVRLKDGVTLDEALASRIRAQIRSGLRRAMCRRRSSKSPISREPSRARSPNWRCATSCMGAR